MSYHKVLSRAPQITLVGREGETTLAVYDFSCDDCGFEFEIERPMSMSTCPATCTRCDSARTRRVINVAPTFVLKGDCWYKDGYTSSQKASESK